MVNNTQPSEKIVEMIRRCLALSKNNPNENEASLALAKAQELLFKYNLSMAEIETAQQKAEKKSTITKEDGISVKTQKNHGTFWKLNLLTSICQYNFCKCLYYSFTMSAVIIGQPYNIEVVKEVYNWIVPQIENLASEACRNYNGYSRIPTFRRSFYEGITVRIDQRLRENWNKMVQASVTSTALVVSNKAALDTFVKETYKKVKESRPQKGSKSYDGYDAGKQAGNKVNLTPSKKIDTNSNLKLS